ncbi:MAG: hypothetical protein NTX15_09745 [Candidatus Kapabacteria bacterium]|nr:hypothetical protein [Candidatus Kapabacteria bacterium]
MNRSRTHFYTSVTLLVFVAASMATIAQRSIVVQPTSLPRSTESISSAVRQTVGNVSTTGGAEEYRQAVTSPILHTTMPKIVDAVQAGLPGIQVGFTYYDFQTNGAMSNRLVYTPDGPDKYVQMVWMTSKDSTRDAATRIPGFAGNNRGTHYTFLIVNSPDAPELGVDDWQKVETLRAGWPSIVQYKDGNIGTPSHTPVRFYGNSGLGDQPVLRKEVTSPSDSAVWARAAVDGQGNTHLIYNRTIISGSAQNQVAYRRSTDGGFTWASEILFTGPNAPEGALQSGLGGDTYAVTARGNKAVITYTDGSLRLFSRTSTDGGATWPSDSARIIFSPNYTDIDSSFNQYGTFSVYSDTVPTPNGHVDVIIDSDGATHYVMGVVPSYVVRKDTNGTRTGSIFVVNTRANIRSMGMLYTKQGEQNLYFMAPPCGSAWDGAGYPMNLRSFDGASRWPQLGINAANDIYCVYGSWKNGDVTSVITDTTGGNQQTEPDTLSQVDGLNGHVWATYKPAGFNIWSAPTDITPAGVSCQYGTLCDEVINGRMYIGYSAATTPGDHVTNVELPAEAAKVMMLAYDVAKLTAVNSVDEERTLHATISVMPNPARDNATIRIASVTGGTITVSLLTTLGETIMTSQSPSTQGEWDVVLATHALSAGTYHCIVEQNGLRSAVPLVIVR